MNPKLFIKVSEYGILIPILGQKKEIDNLIDEILKDSNIVAKTKKKLSPEISEFIIENMNNGECYWSDNYSYNPKTKVFVFASINEMEDIDYEILSTQKTKFDPKKIYTIDESIIKKNIKNNKSQIQVNNVIKTTSKNKKTLLTEIQEKYPCPTIEESGFYIDTLKWQFLIRNIKKNINTMLIGPTGTGKTDIIMRICKQINIPCRVYDMGAMQDPLTDLLGSHRLVNGTSIFDYAKFVEDVQKPGVIILDELSRAPFMTNNILFPCLDQRRTLPIEIADSKSDREIKIHPECIFIATANIGSEYSGTNEIDAALLNRFIPVQFDYLPADIEATVLVNRTHIGKNDAKKIVKVANEIREKYLENELSKSISTRETLACAELIVDGFKFIDAINFVMCEKFLKGVDDEYTLIKKIIMKL